MKEIIVEIAETIELIDQMPTRLSSARTRLYAAIKDRDLVKENLRVAENSILLDDLKIEPGQRQITGTNERVRAAQLEELTRQRREFLRVQEEKVVKADQYFRMEEETFQALGVRAELLCSAQVLHVETQRIDQE